MPLQHLDVHFEVKQILVTDPDFFFIEGLASTFGNMDLVDDIVQRGAFKESLARFMPKILWQHDSHSPIGMPDIIRETDDGLFVKIKLPKADTFVSGRVMPQVKIGSINAMSIGFIIESPEDVERQGDIRLLKKIFLKEISLVSFPANEMALVSGFKNEKDKDKDKVFYDKTNVMKLGKRGLEKALRESGFFSKNAAVYIASQLPGEPAKEPMNEETTAKAIEKLLSKADSIQTNLVLQKILM